MMKIISIVIILGVAWQCQAAAPTKSGIDTAWKLNLDGFSIDPTTWKDDMKNKFQLVGVGASYSMSLGMPLVQTIILSIFLYGLVKLDWVLLGACCAALYGWKRNHKIFLGLGLLFGYCYAFGYKILGA
nr:VP4 [Trichopteran jingmen-related virus]